MAYEMLLSPIKIGNMQLKNRVVMAPMLIGMGDFDGKPTEQLMDYYVERASRRVVFRVVGFRLPGGRPREGFRLRFGHRYFFDMTGHASGNSQTSGFPL